MQDTTHEALVARIEALEAAMRTLLRERHEAKQQDEQMARKLRVMLDKFRETVGRQGHFVIYLLHMISQRATLYAAINRSNNHALYQALRHRHEGCV